MNMRHKIALAIAGGAMFLLLTIVVFGDNGLIELQRLRSRHAELVKVNERLRHENLNMYRSVERLQNDPIYIEHVARQELGMIRPDEIIFKFDRK